MFHCCMTNDVCVYLCVKAVANGLVGQVLAIPLLLKVKNSILQKASIKQKY